MNLVIPCALTDNFPLFWVSCSKQKSEERSRENLDISVRYDFLRNQELAYMKAFQANSFHRA